MLQAHTHTHTRTNGFLWLVRCPGMDWLLRTTTVLKHLPCFSVDDLWLKVMAPEREAVQWSEHRSILRQHSDSWSALLKSASGALLSWNRLRVWIITNDIYNNVRRTMARGRMWGRLRMVLMWVESLIMSDAWKQEGLQSIQPDTLWAAVIWQVLQPCWWEVL